MIGNVSGWKRKFCGNGERHGGRRGVRRRRMRGDGAEMVARGRRGERHGVRRKMAAWNGGAENNGTETAVRKDGAGERHGTAARKWRHGMTHRERRREERRAGNGGAGDGLEWRHGDGAERRTEDGAEMAARGRAQKYARDKKRGRVNTKAPHPRDAGLCLVMN